MFSQNPQPNEGLCSQLTSLFLNLPTELHMEIASHLDCITVLALQMCNKMLYEKISTPTACRDKELFKFLRPIHLWKLAHVSSRGTLATTDFFYLFLSWYLSWVHCPRGQMNEFNNLKIQKMKMKNNSLWMTTLRLRMSPLPSTYTYFVLPKTRNMPYRGGLCHRSGSCPS